MMEFREEYVIDGIINREKTLSEAIPLIRDIVLFDRHRQSVGDTLLPVSLNSYLAIIGHNE
jgi:hypothetical protein